MATALRWGGVPDRVPVFQRDLTLGLDVAGYSTPEVCAGAFDAVRSCPLTRCPRCDAETVLDGDADGLSSLLAAYRRQFGLVAFRRMWPYQDSNPQSA